MVPALNGVPSKGGRGGVGQGNFRGKVEERVQQKGNRRGGAGPGWLAAAPTTGPRKKQRKGGKVS